MEREVVSNNWLRYVQAVAGEATQRAIAARSGIHPSTISKWFSGKVTHPPAESAISFARAFDSNPLHALEAAGYISAEELHPVPIEELRRLSLDELLNEVAHRGMRLVVPAS